MATALSMGWSSRTDLADLNTRQTISATIGDVCDIVFTVVGTGVDVSTWQFEATLSPDIDSAPYKSWVDADFSTKTSGGAFTLEVVTADTSTLPGRNYFLEVRRVDGVHNYVISRGYWSLAPSPLYFPVAPPTGTVTVGQGGTGGTSFTAYAVICGGTGTTAPLQSVSGVGTSGQALISNGASALPTWQTISSGGGTWGSITGTLSAQTDLQAALDAKQASDAQLTSVAALAYAGNAGKSVAVKSDETGFELITVGGGTATAVTVANEASDTTCFVLFATAAAGDLGPKSNAGLTFNSATGILSATGFSGPLTGNVTGNASGSSGSCTGNAATATALATARAINGVNFDGTAAITVTAAAGTLTGTTLASNVVSSSLTSAAGGAFGTAAYTAASAYQSSDATLTAFAALVIAANSLTIGTGADAFSQTTFAANTFPARASSGNLVAKTITDFGLSLVDDADAAAGRTTLGFPTGATGDVLFYSAANTPAVDSEFTYDSASGLLRVKNINLIGNTAQVQVKNDDDSSNDLWIGVSAANVVTSEITGLGDAAFVGNITAGSFASTGTSTLAILIGANATDHGWVVSNSGNATSGNQRYSPTTTWSGRGFASSSGTPSQSVNYRAYVVPVQGSAAPTGVWKLQVDINGGGYSDVLTVTSAGVVTATTLAGALTGNASTATALATPRAINGVNFDGSAAITVPLPLTPTAVKTTTYSAAAGDFVPCDSTSAGFTVTLPTAPADKTLVAIKHVIQGSTNVITYACGGSDVINKASGATSGTLPLLAQAVILQYKASGAIWYVLADDLPLSQLDLRYSLIAGSTSIVTIGKVAATALNFGTYTDNGNSGSSKTIDWTVKNYQKVTLTAACTLTFTAPAGYASVTLELIADGTGNWAVTWPTITWLNTAGATTTPPTTLTANQKMLVTLQYNGSKYRAQYTPAFTDA